MPRLDELPEKEPSADLPSIFILFNSAPAIQLHFHLKGNGTPSIPRTKRTFTGAALYEQEQMHSEVIDLINSTRYTFA